MQAANTFYADFADAHSVQTMCRLGAGPHCPALDNQVKVRNKKQKLNALKVFIIVSHISFLFLL
jgi:hypothetical protein